MKREKIFSIAFGGILTAISLIILFVGNMCTGMLCANAACDLCPCTCCCL